MVGYFGKIMAKENSNTEKSKLVQKVKDLEKDILKLKSETYQREAASAENLKNLEAIESRRLKNLKDYYDLKLKLSELEEKSIKKDKEKKSIHADEIQKLRDAKKLQDETNELQDKSNIIMRSFSENTQRNAELLGIAANASKVLSGEMASIKTFTQATSEQNKIFAETMSDTVKLTSSMDSLSLKIAEQMENINKTGYEAVDTYRLERQLKEHSAKLDINASKMGRERYMIQKKTIDLQLQELNKLKAINTKLAEKSQRIKESKAGMIGLIAAIPGGAFLMDRLGLRKVLDGTKTLGQALGSLAISLPFMVLGGIISLVISGLKILVGFVFDLDKEIANLSKTFAINRAEATGMYRSLGGLALQMNIVGINVKELSDTLDFLTEKYGVATARLEKATSSSRWLQGMTILREKFQLTNEEGLNFAKVASIMNVPMDKLAYAAVKLNNGVLNAKQALKSIANVPQIMAVGMKGAVTELVKFASKAKLMGIDLKGIDDALSGMLDIESSLEKQFTMETITGIHFRNADQMRMAVSSMQYDKAFDMLMTNIGDIKSLADMPGGLIGVKSIADFFGFSLDQFTEYFNRFKELKKVFGENPMEEVAKYQAMNAKEIRQVLKDSHSGLDASQKAFLENMAAEKEGADIAEKFQDKLGKIKIQLMSELTPVLDDLHKTFNDIANSKELKDTIMWVARNIPNIVTSAIELGKTLKSIFSALYSLLLKIGLINEKTFVNSKGQKETIAGINMEWFSMSKILTGIALYLGAGGLLVKGVGWLAKEILGLNPISSKTFKKIAKDIASSGLVSKTEGMGGGLVEGLKSTGGRKNITKNMIEMEKTVGDSALKSGAGSLMKGLGSSTVMISAAYSVGILADSMKKFADVDLKSFGMGIGALTALILGVIGLSAAFTASFEVVLPAIAMLLGLGAAMVLVATSFKIMAESVTILAKGLQEMTNVDSKKLYNLSNALYNFSKAMLAFGIGKGIGSIFGAIGGVFDFVGKLFGSKGPIEIIIDTIKSTDTNQLYNFAGGMSAIAKSIQDLQTQLNTLDINKLEAAASKMQPGGDGFFSSVGRAADSLWSGVKSFFGFGEQNKSYTSPVTPTSVYAKSTGGGNTATATNQPIVNINTAALEQKLDKLINVINNMASQPTYIKIGEQTVEAIRNEINWKKQNIIGVDNRYSGGFKD